MATQNTLAEALAALPAVRDAGEAVHEYERSQRNAERSGDSDPMPHHAEDLARTGRALLAALLGSDWTQLLKDADPDPDRFPPEDPAR